MDLVDLIDGDVAAVGRSMSCTPSETSSDGRTGLRARVRPAPVEPRHG